jgi:purine nucleosidase
VPITLVTLDATRQVPLREAFLDRLERQSASRASRLASGVWGVARKHLSRQHPGAYCLWDTLTSAAMIEPRLIRTERMPIRVVTEGPDQGRTIEDPGGTVIDVAVAADAARTEALFLEILGRGPG